MNKPSIIVRTAGSPVVAIPLTLGGMSLIFMWTQGRASVWLALAGLFVVVRTFSSVRQRRGYNAWLRQWESVGTFGKATPRRPVRPWRWMTVLASLLFIGIVVFKPAAPSSPELQQALMWIWLCCGAFLVARLVIGIGRWVFKRRGSNAERAKLEAAPVSLMLSRTVDSPSREMAVRSLPEYAARVLSR